MPAAPPTWHTYGGRDSFQGYDIAYGGWDSDALQADIGGPGPDEGDRLLDWAGAYNVYFVCPGAYGEGVIDRAQSPDVQKFLEDLIEGDGALQPNNRTRSGGRELGYVYHQDVRYNSHPPHPEHPGNFTCVCEE